jgi:hypothetical protein
MPKPPPETLAWLRHAASCGKADAQLTLHILERLEALERRPIPGTVELADPTPEAAPVADNGGPQTVHACALDMVNTLAKLGVSAESLLTLRRAIREPMGQPTPKPATHCPTDAASLLWILWNHQGSRSPEGQAIRKYLGIGRFDRMTADQVEAAKNYAMDQLPAAQPAPPVAPAGGLVERVAEKMGPQSQAAMDAGELPYGAARAAIREVAAWLRSDYGGREGYGTSWANLIEEEANR